MPRSTKLPKSRLSNNVYPFDDLSPLRQSSEASVSSYRHGDQNATTPELDRLTYDSNQPRLASLLLEAQVSSPQHNEVSAIPIKRARLPLSSWELLAHSASIGTAAVIFWLCGTNVFFKDNDTRAINSLLNTFQFIAALHTGIVVASLSYIALYHVRYELCLAKGIPLDYLTVPFQLSSLFLLFRPQFWKAFIQKTNTRRHVVLAVGLIVAMLLQALAAPASAVLIVPQLQWWQPANAMGQTSGFSYINSSYERLWPDHLTNKTLQDPEACGETDILINRRCPYTNMAAISKWAMVYRNQYAKPNLTIVATANVARYLGASLENEDGYSAATTPMDNLVGDFGGYWSYAIRESSQLPFTKWATPRLSIEPYDENFPILRPFVQVQCSPLQLVAEQQDERLEANFPGDKIVIGPVQRLNDVKASIDASLFTTNETRSTIFGFRDLSAEAKTPSLGLIAGLWLREAGALFPSLPKNSFAPAITTCRVSAKWIPTSMSINPKTQNITNIDHTDPDAVTTSSLLSSHSRSINIDTSFANKINIWLKDKTTTVLEYEERQLKFSDGYNANWKSKLPWTVATMASLQIADGLSHIHWDRAHFVFCEGCSPKSTEGKSYLQNLGSIRNEGVGIDHTSNTSTQQQTYVTDNINRFYPLRWRGERYGYGWSLGKVTSWFAVGVIFVHVLLVVVHVGIVMKRQVQFMAWGELWELLALANHSPASEDLRGMSLGIVDHAVHRRIVRMERVRDKHSEGTLGLTVGDIDSAGSVAREEVKADTRYYG